MTNRTVTVESARTETIEQGRRQMGGALVAAGAGAFLAHSILMVVALVSLFSAISLDVERVVAGITGALVAYLAATISVLFASFLVGAGALSYQRGVSSLAWTDARGQRFAAAAETRDKAKAAGALVVAYGALGVVAIANLAQMVFGGPMSQGDLFGSMRLAFVLWAVAAVVLCVAAGLFDAFLSALRRDLAYPQAPGGGAFLAYAIVNAIGVFLFVLPVVIVGSTGSGFLGGLAIASAGLFLEFLVVPIIGIVTFSLLVSTGLRMRRLVRGPHAPVQPPVPVLPYVTVYPYPVYAAPPPPPPAAPARLPGPPPDDA